ncbi:MAG: Holliday junction resolvase-like protein [Thermoplasmata archaeon]
MDPYFIITLILLILLTVFIILYVLLKIRLNSEIQRKAMDVFKKWIDTTLQSEKENIRETVENEYKIMFEKWKIEYSEEIRRDAIQKSQNVLKGKVTEQIIPYFSDFPYDPRDVRFIGSPVDLIVFSGLREKNSIDEIIFLEIKTGKGRQSGVEKKVEDAIKNGKISYRVINVLKETL